MLFIKNWNKASLDKSSNSIVSRYKSKISSLADKTESLRQLLNDLYDEAVILNDRIIIDKQAIQEDLNDTATDLRETCNNSSWGQAEIESVQGLLDEAEEDISDIQTDIDIATGCLVVCQSGQGSDCGQPCVESCNQPCSQPCSQPCNETTCIPCEAMVGGCNAASEDPVGCELMGSEDCVVIVGGVFNCTGVNDIIDDCYGGCYNNQSCDSQTKTCPKCHGSEIDIIEICTGCDTDHKTTCGTFDTQDGCDTDNATGNCDTKNTTGTCTYTNTPGTDCVGTVTGNCGTDNDSPTEKPEDSCNLFNKPGTMCKTYNSKETDCESGNSKGDCYSFNTEGNCDNINYSGTCKTNDGTAFCPTNNTGDQGLCGLDNDIGDCTTDNTTGNCGEYNTTGNCYSDNKTGNCTTANPSGDCYSDNTTGNCQTENATGECTSQSCSSGQDCTGCIEDQKTTTTTEECKAGANIGEQEYCDSCQGTESSEVEIPQEELEKDCGPMFENGADACGPEFANCFNTSECDGATWGVASGCGTLEGCGSCNENDSCTDGQSCATGQTCGYNDCGQDCYESCYEPCNESCSQPCSESCSQPCGETPPCDDSCDCDGYVPCDFGCTGELEPGCCDGCNGPDFA